MEISKEFSLFQENNKNVNDIILSLKEEEKIIAKKIHLFEVLKLVSDIQEIIHTDLFKKSNIATFNIFYQGYRHKKELFSFKDSNGEYIPKSNIDQNLMNTLNEVFDAFAGFFHKHVNDKLKAGSVDFHIDENIKNNLINLLLSKEIKSTLEFNELQHELIKNGKENKTMKI